MELSEAKNYLRIDQDITSDDDMIQSFIIAAESYIKQKSGKTQVKTEVDEETGLPTYGNIENDKIFDLCVKLLLSHWYVNRDIEILGTLSKVSHSVDAIIDHIALCGDYIGD